MNILIATAQAPKSKQHAIDLNNQVRDAAKQEGFEVRGCKWTSGPGCQNYAIHFVGSDTEADIFGKLIALALMPSKWCETPDDVPPGNTYEL